ncbi:unnamed protein product [Prorocentrum cordatum]|uniref:CCHC-type domain-containing protein n=1 Tax=Prorocentrum cordatum TaxID=2364126 RepID=A0ABN9RWI6_9DINO|nr:unnamed protein product [Polarella glacialis]
MEAALQELQRIVGEQAAQIQRLTEGAQRPEAQAEDRRLESIVDTKILSRIGVFSGADEEWRQWCFVFESTAGLVDLEQIMTHCENTDETELGWATQSERVQLRMKVLYHLLIAATRGKALTILQMVPKNNGAIGWKRLKDEYEPKSGGRLTAMLMGVLKPEWETAIRGGIRTWEAAWKEWEKSVSLYEAQSLEKVTEGTRPWFVKLLGAIGQDYHKLAKVVTDYIASGKVYETTGAPHGIQYDGPMPMDVGLVNESGDVGGVFKPPKGYGKQARKDAGKGRDSDRDTCKNCSKRGHWSRGCWAPGGGAANQMKGKGKDTKGGKGGKERKKCDKCGKPGHEAKDCRSHIKCDKCGKLGHKASDCRSKPESAEVKRIVNEQDELWVMGVAESVNTIDDGSKYVWVSIDSGSDADGCPLGFGHSSDDVEDPTKVELRTATNDEIQDYGERNVGIAFLDETGHEVMATNRFRIGDFSKPVLSCGIRVTRGAVIHLETGNSYMAPPSVNGVQRKISLTMIGKSFYARRLGIIDAAIYGTKKQLRERLVKCEHQLDEKMKVKEALEERQRRLQEGVDPEVPRTLKTPERPDAETVRQHELTHAKFEPWRLECVFGKGDAAPHRGVQFLTDKEPEVSVVQIDYHFLKDDGEETEDAANRFSTTLAVIDCDTGVPLQLGLPEKGGNRDYTVASVVSFLRRLGAAQLRLRSDGEPSVVGIANAVAAKRLKFDGYKVTVEQTPRYSSQSLGAAGVQQKILQGQARTIRAATEKMLGIKIGPGHVLWPWLVRHVGFIAEMFHIKSNGRTPHQDATGTKYHGVVLKFAETAMFKHPTSSSGHMTGGRRSRKSKSMWEKGIFLGKTYESDEFLMGTSSGVHSVRAVRRLPEEGQCDLELVAKMVGAPGVGQIGRPKGKRVVILPTAPPEKKQEETEVDDAKEEKGVTDPTVERGVAEDGNSYASARGRTGSGYMEDVALPTPRHEAGGSSSSRPAQPTGEPEVPEVEMGTVGGVDGFVIDEIDLMPVMDPDGKCKDINAMQEFGVFEAVSPDEIDSTWTRLSTKWVYQEKSDEIRCRFVTREFKSMDPEREGLFTPASEPATGRLMDFKAVNRDQPTVIIDAVNAYFHAEQDRLVAVVPPREWVEAEAIKGNTTRTMWRMKKKLYGERDASRGFSDFMNRILVSEMEFEQCPDQPCFYRRERDSVDLELHQDDIYATADDIKLQAFTTELSSKVSKLLKVGAKYQHLKGGRVRVEGGMFQTGNRKYADKIIELLNLGKETSLYRQCVGIARYMVNYVTEVTFAVHVLSKRLATPTDNDMKRLKHLGRYLLGVRDYALFFPRAGEADILECYTDSDWAGDTIDRKSVSCGVLCCGGCTLLEYSRGQSTQALSSGEAEYYASATAAAEAIHLQSAMGFLDMNVKIRIRIDSSAGQAVCHRVGVGGVRHLEVRTLWLQAKVRDKKLAVVKQAGETNLADVGTKALTSQRFHWLRAQLERRPLAGADDMEESTAVRVNLVSDSTSKMARVGAALIALLDSLGSVKADGECDVYGYEKDKTEIILQDARLGTGVHLQGMMLIVVMITMMIVACAVGGCAGWCVSYFMRPSRAGESRQEKKKVELSQRAIKTKKVKIEYRTVSTQSQVTYSWHRESPRPCRGAGAAGAAGAPDRKGAPPPPERRSTGPLSGYFGRSYLEGQLYQGPAYVRSFDVEFQLPVLTHEESGIRVWSEALDLRAAAPDSRVVVLYLYTDRAGFSRIASTSAKEVEVFTGFEDKLGPFGRGVAVTRWEPDAFHSKREALLNNHWPCMEAGEGGEPRVLRQVNPRSGPDDPWNAKLVESILRRGAEHAGCADFCIPVLVPSCFAYNIWEQMPPDLEAEGIEVGCNRWGEPQWPDRDVWVVQLSEQGASRAAAAGSGGKVEVFRQRLRWVELQKGGEHADALSALSSLASTLKKLGMFQEAEPLYRKALEGCQRTRGESHPETLGVINSLALLLDEVGEHDEAEALARQALAGHERTLGSEHPATLRSMGNLAGMLAANGQRVEAEGLYRAVIRGWEARGQRAEPDMLTALSDLALLLEETGKLAEAETCFRRALQGMEASLGPCHLDTLCALNDLGVFLKKTGQFPEAEKLSWRALDGWEQARGRDHPHTLASASNLALVLQEMDRRQEAEPLFRRALEGSERSAGRAHPDTLMYVSHLAELLRATGRAEDRRAEPLFRRALEGREAALGRSHPDTLASLHGLALLVAATGRAAEAEQLLRRAIDERGGALGWGHPDTLASMSSLASALHKQGRSREAEPFAAKALAGREASLGPQHVDTLRSRTQLAQLLREAGRLSEAEPHAVRASKDCEEAFGPHHAATLQAQSGLALLLQAQGRHREAEPLVRRVLESKAASLGRGHPETLSYLVDLALLLQKLGKHREAEPLCRGAVDGLEQALGPAHPDVARASDALAGLLEELGRPREAEEVYRHVLKRRREALGERHPDTLRTMCGLAMQLKKRNKYEEAEATSRAAVEGFEATLGPEHPETLRATHTLVAVLLEERASGTARQSPSAGRCASATRPRWARSTPTRSAPSTPWPTC